MDSTATEQVLVNFPLRFANGHTIDTLVFWCVKCGKLAQDTQVFGQISRIVPHAADVRASYQCSCGHPNAYRIRLKDNKSFTWLADDVWREQLPPKPSIVTGLRRQYYRTFWSFKMKWVCFLMKRYLKRLHCSIQSHSK